MNTFKPPQPAEIILSQDQEAARRLAISGRNVLVTGSAGTGKSFLLRQLCEDFKHQLPVTASTGIAAVGVGGLTLHSWAGIGLADRPARQLAAAIQTRRGAPWDRIRGSERLAIDEISMVSADLLDCLDEVFRIVRERKDLPFGGMRLICFGDFLQLPPVDRGRNGARFCFDSDAWLAADIRVQMLTKVWRQQDEAFSQSLNDLRVGDLSQRAKELLNSRYRTRATDPNPEIKPVIVYSHNADVDRMNREVLDSLEGDSKTFHADDSGRSGPLASLQAYVALSRVKTLEGLFIEDYARGAIRANPEAVEFYRRALA